MMADPLNIEALRKVAEALRALRPTYAQNGQQKGWQGTDPEDRAKADLIDRVLSELEAVKGERDGWRRLCGDHQTAQDAAEAALASLKEERDSLLAEGNRQIGNYSAAAVDWMARAQAAEQALSVLKGEMGSSSVSVQAAPDGATEGQRSAGWLVERENRDGLMYAMATRWDRDHAKAIRFSRQEDAAAFAECHAKDFTRVAEHRWG